MLAINLNETKTVMIVLRDWSIRFGVRHSLNNTGISFIISHVGQYTCGSKIRFIWIISIFSMRE